MDSVEFYLSGSTVAVRNPTQKDSFKIVQCLNDIVTNVSRHKIRTLIQRSVSESGTTYIFGKEDYISSADILFETKLCKLTRFTMFLSNTEKDIIRNAIQNDSPAFSQSRAHKIQWNEVNIVTLLGASETKSIFNGTLAEITGSSKEMLLDNSELGKINNSSPQEFNANSNLVSRQVDLSSFRSEFVENRKEVNRADIRLMIEKKNFKHLEMFSNICNIGLSDTTLRDINLQAASNSVLTEIPTARNVETVDADNMLQISNSDKLLYDELEHSDHYYGSSGSEYVPSISSSVKGEIKTKRNKNRRKKRNQINDSVSTSLSSMSLSKSSQLSLNSSNELIENNNGGTLLQPISDYTSAAWSKTTTEISLKRASKTLLGKRVYDKRHACYFCGKIITKVARHLESVHANELEVAKLLGLEKQCLKRKEGFLCLLRAGDYYHNCKVVAVKSGELLLGRRQSREDMKKYDANDYGPCANCLAFFLLKHLWHHSKHSCPKKNELKEKTCRRDIKGESYALLTIYDNTFSDGFKIRILSKLKHDEVSSVCKEDELILNLGSMLFEKYGNQQDEFVRQTMRQLGRLILQVKKVNPSSGTIRSIIKPKHFDCLISAVQEVCCSTRNAASTREYGIPSLALKLGHSLRKCAQIARGIALRESDFSSDREMESFLQHMSFEWSLKISIAAIRTLHAKKLNSPYLLPLTQDLMELNKYLEHIITKSSSTFYLKHNTSNWTTLASATLCRIILFNKRRSGEASRMTLAQYAARPNWTEQTTEEFRSSLTPLEKSLANRLTIVEVPGRSRSLYKVPILLTLSMKLAIDKLIETRNSVGVDEKNDFIFARSKHSLGNLRGHDCLRFFCKQANLKQPSLVTGTKLRKYIATVVQMFDLKETETDWLARHLGHDITIHRQFYRLHESAVEMTKVSRILLAIDRGDASKFQGKSLDEINVDELENLEESGSEIDIQDVPEVFQHITAEDVNDVDNSPTSHMKEADQITHSVVREELEYKIWKPEEKQLVLEFFRDSIRNNKIPGKLQAEECIKKHANILGHRSWKNIKYFVYNHINSCKKKRSD